MLTVEYEKDYEKVTKYLDENKISYNIKKHHNIENKEEVVVKEKKIKEKKVRTKEEQNYIDSKMAILRELRNKKKEALKK